MNHEGSTTNQDGKTATRNDKWQRDGNTVNHEGSNTGFNGGTRERSGSFTGDGSGWKGQSGGSFKPSFKDDYDIFGGRGKPKPKAGGSGSRSSGGAKARGGRR